MALHKIIEAGGEGYLPFAQSKIPQLVEQAAGGEATKTWFTNTGHVISVRVCGTEHYIRVKGGGVAYEFFTADHIGYDRFGELQAQYPGDYTRWQHQYVIGTPGHATVEAGLPGEPTYLPHVAGHFTRAAFKAKTEVLPIYSHTLTAPALEVGETAPKWVTLPTTFVEGSPGPAGMKPILTPYVWQLQRFKESVWWPSQSSMMMSTQAQAPGRSNTCNLSSAQTYKPVYAYNSPTFGGLATTPDPSYLVDHGYDVMPTYLAKGLTISKGPIYPEPGVWWRRAATARSDRGNLFFICTDNIGRFQVYRALDENEAAASATHVRRALSPGDGYRQYTPPYPGWVTMPGAPVNLGDPGEDALFDDHCWMWSFNSSGTRAAAIAFSSVASPHYRKKKSGVGGMIGAQYDAHESDPIENAIHARDDIPGLVEFEIAIVEGLGTNPGDLEFSVNFTLLKSEPHSASGHYLLEAAYALPKVAGVAQDTLLVSEIKLAASSITGYEGADPGGWGAVAPMLDFDLSVECLTTVWSCSALNDAMQRTELRSFKISNNDSMRFPDWDAVWEMPETDRNYLFYYLGLNNAKIHRIPLTKFRTASGAIVNGVSPGPVGWSLLHDEHENIRRYFGNLWSADLASLSFFFSYADQRTVMAGYHLVAFNKTFVKHDAPVALSTEDQDYINTLGAGNPVEIGANGLPSIPSPVFLRLCRFVQHSVLATAPWTGFSVHPDGHWSHAGPHGVDEEFDIVKPAGRDATSHKRLFDTAFGQNRAHSYYAELYDEGLTANGSLSEAELGSFRTTGIWITF